MVNSFNPSISTLLEFCWMLRFVKCITGVFLKKALGLKGLISVLGHLTDGTLFLTFSKGLFGIYQPVGQDYVSLNISCINISTVTHHLQIVAVHRRLRLPGSPSRKWRSESFTDLVFVFLAFAQSVWSLSLCYKAPAAARLLLLPVLSQRQSVCRPEQRRSSPPIIDHFGKTAGKSKH